MFFHLLSTGERKSGRTAYAVPVRQFYARGPEKARAFGAGRGRAKTPNAARTGSTATFSGDSKGTAMWGSSTPGGSKMITWDVRRHVFVLVLGQPLRDSYSGSVEVGKDGV